VSRFDVLLVLGYSRSAPAYLSIIRHLSPGLRIGMLVTDPGESFRQKTGQAQALFLRLCRDFGAEILDDGVSASARLMIVQQFPYSDQQAADINARVRAERRAGLMSLAVAGLDPFDRFIEQFSIDTVYVPSRRFMNFLLERRNAADRYRSVRVEEVGLPFGVYPVFPDFHTDWLIAAPTLFSFSTETGKQAFLNCVLSLMSQIPSKDVIVYKPHNGNQLDYFAPRAHYVLASAFTRMPGGERLLGGLSRIGPHMIRQHFSRILTSALHQNVLRRAVPMTSVTPYADISLEAFLPGVRKGVIGGLSNTIWGTLYFRLPFFNCADPSRVDHGESELLNKSSEALLKINLEYFGVPYCAGDICRGATGEDIVVDSDRTGDLLKSIKADLAAVS
jgi:hypothetical protein